MGQKTSAIGLRLGINRTSDSRWHAKKEYGNLLHRDLKIRKFINETLAAANISRIIINRAAKDTHVIIHTARPGVIIGKGGVGVGKLAKDLQKFTDGEVKVHFNEVRKPEIESKLVAETVANMLERRVTFRRAMKRAVQNAMRMGAQGIRINVAGRLGGAEIARMEWYREGRVPLHTLRANIDYALAEAKTTYGVIGIQVWLFKGEILAHDPMAQDKLWGGETRTENRER